VVKGIDTKENGDYQELGEGRKRSLLFNGYRISGLQDENIL
jgi:hypothetical protein